MHSFESLLIDWLTRLTPRRVVEWGPGRSTELILQHAPDCQLVTIENRPTYFTDAVNRFGDRCTVRHEAASTYHSQYAACVLDLGPFDLAFVDGRRRVECCLMAAQVLSPDGVILIHDWDRRAYHQPLNSVFHVIEERDRTAVLRMR